MDAIPIFVVHPSDYDEFLLACPDARRVDYETYRKEIEEFCESHRKQGRDTVKMQCDIRDFVHWATSQGRPCDAGARADYAAFMYLKK